MSAKDQGLLLGVGCLVTMLAIWQYYFRSLSPHAVAAHEFYKKMPAEEILEIDLEPYSVLSLVNKPLKIKDRLQIKRLADSLRQARPFSPNHPQATWIVVLRIITRQGEYGGHVESTHNQQGVQIWYSSNIEGGWNYGTYRQDDLGPLLEEVVRPMMKGGRVSFQEAF